MATFRVFRRLGKNDEGVAEVQYEYHNVITGVGRVLPQLNRVAKEVKQEVMIGAAGPVVDTSIIFKPQFGLVWRTGERYAHRCLPLSESEQQLFWQIFTAS